MQRSRFSTNISSAPALALKRLQSSIARVLHSLIRELRDKLDLREDLAVTGEDLRTRLNPESLVGWAEGQRVLPKSRWRTVAVALALCSVAAILYYFAGGPYRIALIFLAVDAIFLRALKKRAQAVIHEVSCNAEGLLLFSPILQRLEREPLASPRLRTDRKSVV